MLVRKDSKGSEKIQKHSETLKPPSRRFGEMNALFIWLSFDSRMARIWLAFGSHLALI